MEDYSYNILYLLYLFMTEMIHEMYHFSKWSESQLLLNVNEVLFILMCVNFY